MKYAVLDLETTGHQADDEIIQVGIVMLDEQLKVVDTFSSFVKPSIPIPDFITQLTGIDDAMVIEAPPIEEVLLDVIPLLNDVVLVAHNVGFDAGFLNQCLERCGYMPFSGRRLDTVELLRMLFPSLNTYQLGAVSEHFGIVHERQHQADSDALATAELFNRCAAKLADLPLMTLQRLSSFFGTETDLGWFIDEARQEKELQTSVDPDAYAYFRQFALKVQDWTEEHPARYNDAEQPLKDIVFSDFLDQLQQSFRERLPQYEEREAQNQMFYEVSEALQNNRHLLIEAGTGTGKSLGYLIPSLFYGVQQEQKVVISTHTINLQEQLRERDIPLLHAFMPFEFRASIFKGRGNYLCLRKFEGKINVQDFISPGEDKATAAQMIIWLGETEHGDQEELNFGNKGADFWETVSSDADSCLNRACPWFKRCFYHRAKQEANLADIVITNHSMLFTDIRADHRLLPAYEHLIVDEAHHLEEVAGKHLGLQMSYFTITQPMVRLCKDARTGQLPLLRSRLQREDEEFAPAMVEKIDELIPVFAHIRDDWDQLLDRLYGFASAGAAPNDSGESTGIVNRLKSSELPDGWDDAMLTEANLFAQLGKITKGLDKLLSEIKDRIDDHGIQALITDMNGSVKDLARAKDDLHSFMKMDEPTTVYWIEANQNFRAKSVFLYAVPANVSEQLQKYFFETKKSITLTSATLSVQKSFQYACEQFGLQEQQAQGRLKTVQLPSPFNYREQALVVIPRDFPSVKGTAGDPKFINMLVASLAEAAQETKGRMLVLFTAYRMLKQVYEPLKEALHASGIQVLGQGIDSGNRSKLTRRFQQQQASVLLGTSSFWEGVDLPGEALVCLAIIRLPFQPPNHPLVEAKAEMLQQQKQNPFMKLSIPQAVIRFKQGFGRLVRSTQDRGIVLIYDTRVIETYYGKYFLYSLPGPKIEHMHLEQIVPRMRQWLEAGIEEAQA